MVTKLQPDPEPNRCQFDIDTRPGKVMRCPLEAVLVGWCEIHDEPRVLCDVHARLRDPFPCLRYEINPLHLDIELAERYVAACVRNRQKKEKYHYRAVAELAGAVQLEEEAQAALEQLRNSPENLPGFPVSPVSVAI